MLDKLQCASHCSDLCFVAQIVGDLPETEGLSCMGALIARIGLLKKRVYKGYYKGFTNYKGIV